MPLPTVGLRSRGFVAFITTQFLGAFNDNAYRFSLLLFLHATLVDAAVHGRWVALAQLLFALPFIVLAAWAGMVADRWSKTALIRLWKLAELVIMVLGVLAFFAGSTAGLVVVLFLMAAQSTFFGPCKYGFLAERVEPSLLTRANGLVQMFTMAAIVGGQLAAGVVSSADPGNPGWATLTFPVLAALGLIASLGLPPGEAARPQAKLSLGIVAELRQTTRAVHSNPTLRYVMLGIGHFFMLAALLQVRLLGFGTDELGLSETGATAMVAITAVGIGLGSLLAGRWSAGRVELGLVPVGAVAMSVALLVLAGAERWPLPIGLTLFEGGLWWPFLVTLCVGVAGGLYVVPLWALLQLHAPEGEKGRFLAFANMVSFLGVGASALVLWLPAELGLSLRNQLLVVALVSLAGSIVALRLLPYACVRLIAWLLTHGIYRIRVLHAARLPERGGALLLANHVSWVDALILQAVSPRKLHFLMHRPYYEWWPLRWLFKLVGAIPVDSSDDRQRIADSLARAGQLVEDGRLVVIFPEGAVTRLGHMLPFRTGYQRILAGRDIPILPVHLGGLWGSLFSHERGRLLFKWPRGLPDPVTVTIGEALPASSSPGAVRAALRGLAAESWEQRTQDRPPVHQVLLRHERRATAPRLFAPGRAALSGAGTLARARVLAHKLQQRLPAGEHVALAIDEPVEQCLAQLALLLAGRVPLLIDPRASAQEQLALAERHGAVALLSEDSIEARESARDASSPRHAPNLLSWRALVASCTRAERLTRGLLDALCPWPLLRRLLPRAARGSAEDPAYRLVTSDGEVLAVSHAQLHAQVAALQQVLGADARNGVLGLLPLSSAYGQLATLWFPLLAGLRVGWHRDPADRRSLARLLRKGRLDALPARPADLELLLEHARPDTLGGLRYVLCGESTLSPELRDLFLDRFGLEPLPCWTATLAGGLLTLNSPDVRGHGLSQRGTRRGTLGHPLPGVSVVALDEQGAELPSGEVGRLCVRAPGLPARLRAAGGAAHGWQLAADGVSVLTDQRGAVDADGFVLPA